MSDASSVESMRKEEEHVYFLTQLEFVVKVLSFPFEGSRAGEYPFSRRWRRRIGIPWTNVIVKILLPEKVTLNARLQKWLCCVHLFLSSTREIFTSWSCKEYNLRLQERSTTIIEERGWWRSRKLMLFSKLIFRPSLYTTLFLRSMVFMNFLFELQGHASITWVYETSPSSRPFVSKSVWCLIGNKIAERRADSKADIIVWDLHGSSEMLLTWKAHVVKTTV